MTLLDPRQCDAVAGGAGYTPWGNLGDIFANLPKPIQPPIRPFPPVI